MLKAYVMSCICEICRKRWLILIISSYLMEKILKHSLDSIPSPSLSVKIQTMSGKVCLRRQGKTLLSVVNNLTPPSNTGLIIHCGKTYYISRYVKSKTQHLVITIMFLTFSYKTDVFSYQSTFFK